MLLCLDLKEAGEKELQSNHALEPKTKQESQAVAGSWPPEDKNFLRGKNYFN